MRYFFLSCLIISTCCYSQDKALLDIVNSDSPLEVRQQQIDSLVKIKELESSSELLAEFYHDLGSKWYHNNWWDYGSDFDMDKAISYMQKAHEIKRENSNLKEGSREKTLFNLGYYNYLNGKIYNAIDHYRILVDTGKDSRLIQKANKGLGVLYMSIGDFYKALERFNRVIAFYSNNPGNESTLIKTHIQLAETYSLMGIKDHSEKIRLHLNEADSIFNKSENEEYYLMDAINQLEGNRLLETGEYERATTYHKKVLKDSANLYDSDINMVLNSLAYSQLKLKEYESAKLNLDGAISYDKIYSGTYENLGDLYVAQKQFEKGLFFYQNAIVFATDKTKEIKYDKLPTLQELELSTNKLLLLNHVVTKANGWLKFYEEGSNREHLVHSLETFTLADQFVDIIRSESTEYQSKLFWREKGSSLYAKAVEVCYLLDKPEEAYYFMERNKALLLLEDVTSEQAKEITQLPKAMVKKEYELKQAIFLAENELQNSKTASQDSLSLLKEIIYDHKRSYNTFVDSLSSAFPEYAKIKKKVDVMPFDNFKKSFISDDEVVLQYILNDEQGYGLLNSADKTHFIKLDYVDELNEDLIALYGQLTEMTSNRKKMATYSQLSNAVFNKLVPEEVYNEIKGKKLTIVSDYILQQIPFEAFVVDTEKVRYLIEDVEIRYAYSMSYLEAKKGIDQNPEKELLGVAPVQFASLGLPDLTFSGEEINEVQKIYDGRIALNKEATKSSLLADLNDYKIVHLSTHADVGEGGNPWIAFSDEKLFLNEIYANKNQADMVVLSGCNTSLGELKKGEGAMSLARGFFHSGAKSVVSSLWTINDKTSKDLMASFYKALDQGMTKSAALRKAKIDYIDQYRGTTVSPSFWAALIVIGDNSPITTSIWASSNWIWILLGLSIIALLGFFFFKRKKRVSVIPKRSAA